MKNSIDSLLLEVRAGKDKPKERPAPYSKEKAEPGIDAIVQITIVSTCTCCETQYTYPNDKLLVRKGNHIKTPTKWVKVLNKTPREEKIIHKNVESCSHCYKGRSLDQLVNKDHTKKR